MYKHLYTVEGRNLPDIPWNDYPRPQMKRKKWLCLNGQWDYEVQVNGVSSKGVRKIMVPFCPECLLSGIHESYDGVAHMRYTRQFTLPIDFADHRILLHFGAVDQKTRVFVNDELVGKYAGGYLPFSFDITDAIILGENTLVVEAEDGLDSDYPWGKQKVNRGGMWYTPVSGIWQTVWIEPVPQKHIHTIGIRTENNTVHLTFKGIQEGSVIFEEKEYDFVGNQLSIEIENPVHWSPENPHLYYFTVKSGEDEINSYFALRTLEIQEINGKKRLCLNGQPYFFHAVLDQGYWSDGLYTPATPKLYEKDILNMKALGFNTLRKHIKVEAARFYYDCDRLGMIVFQDMVNNGSYSYLRDTVLPTIGFQKVSDRFLNPSKKVRTVFLKHMHDIVECLNNYPCIVLWTIFNEGWGQFNADKAYELLKIQDPTRWIDATSGWFRQKKSDFDSRHIYFKPLKMQAGDKPLLLSEYGGYVWKDLEHSFNQKKTYGYKICETREEFVSNLQKLLNDVVKLAQKGLCGAVYTQVSDVEDETNGLMTYDRMICKVKPEEVVHYAHKLQEAVKK